LWSPSWSSCPCTASRFSRTSAPWKNGIEHSIPVSASFNLFNYINISPSFNYTEKWYFKKQEYQWNPTTNQTDTLASDYGFYRLYNYTASVSASTTLYGMYDFTKKRRDRKIQAIRHTITPSIGFSFAPDFSDPRYGYYLTRQTDSTGRFTTYSPYAVNAYGVPSSGKDVDELLAVAEPRNEGALQTRHVGRQENQAHRRIAPERIVQLPGRLDEALDDLDVVPHDALQQLRHQPLGHDRPLRVTPEGIRYDKLFFPGRITSTGWSFGYTFKSRDDR